jgi:hypothetical protein
VLTTLTRTRRLTAGRLLALAYLFCVLAPGAALALGDAASCLMPRSEMAAAAHVHDGAQPEHAASHQHHGMQADHQANAGHANSEHPKDQHNGKGAIGPCCALLCVSAIAANVPSVATPSEPISLCVSENFQRLPGNAPPLLYRPPIA